MRRGAPGRPVVGLVTLALVLGAALGPAPAGAATGAPAVVVPTQAAGSGAGDPALAELAACVREEGHLLVVMLIDESGSLRDTDPEDQRVAAANSALRNLESLASSDALGEPPVVEVLLAGFSASYTPLTAWEPLGPGSIDVLTDVAGLFADRDAGLDTDFTLAFDGAVADLDTRAGELVAEGVSPCQQVLLFTDGRFDVEARSEQQAADLGATKPYAPDLPLTDPANVDAVVAAGRERLCGVGGTMDRLRQTGAITTTVALTGAIDPVDQDFLEALSTGTGGGQTCGTDPGEQPVGTFVPAASLGELVLAFDQVVDEVGGATALPPAPVEVCAEEACAEGERAFAVDPEIARVVLRAALAGDDARLELALPAGALVLDDRADAVVDVGGVALQVDWLTDTVVRVSADQPAGAAGWAGTWRAVEVAPAALAGDAADVRVALTPGLVPELVEEPSLLTSRSTPIEVLLRGPGGAVLDAADVLTRATVAATVDTGAGPEPVDLAPGPDGTLVGEVALPSEVEAEFGSLEIVVSLATSDGTSLVPVTTRAELPVVSVQTRPVLSTSELGLRADGSVATGEVRVLAAPGADACVWASAVDLPTDAGAASVTLAGGAGSPGECVVVPAGSEARLPVVVDLGGAGAGTWTGSITVALGTTIDDVTEEVAIPLAVERAAIVDGARRLLIFAGLVAVGVLLPLLGAWLVDLLRGRFRPPADLEVVDLAVVVRRDGGIYRPGTLGGRLALEGEDWGPAELARGRSRSWRGLDLWVANSISPFSPPVGLVRGVAPTAGSEGVVEADGLVGRLRLPLAGGWVFVLDADATRQAAIDPTAVDFYAAYGRLVVFRSGATPVPLLAGELARDLPHRAQGLARTVRAAHQLADEGTGQDMLDFIDAHVREVRGLPRYGVVTEEVDVEPEPDLQLATPRNLYDFSDLGEFARFVDDEPAPAVDDGAAELHDVEPLDADVPVADDDADGADGDAAWPVDADDEVEPAVDADDEVEAEPGPGADVALDDAAEATRFDPTDLRIEGGTAWRRFQATDTVAPAPLDPGAGRDPIAVGPVGGPPGAAADDVPADDWVDEVERGRRRDRARAAAEGATVGGPTAEAPAPRATPAAPTSATEPTAVADAAGDRAEPTGGAAAEPRFEPLDLPWADDEEDDDGDGPASSGAAAEPDDGPPATDPVTRWATRRAPSWPVPRRRD